MSSVQKVLDEKPSNWENASYTETTFHLFDLTEGEEEFSRVAEPFLVEPQISIKELKRVQNPFQLGTFLLRQSQKEHRREGNVRPVICYHPINKDDLNTALLYNMDIRRYRHKYSTLQYDKNPKFFATPQAAYQAISSQVSNEDKIILVCNVLDNPPVYSSEFMPLYVAMLR